jgi:Tol biopolymer transport system component/DNA-binding winged helix-turn-helix (wHTH) protein
MGPPVGGCFAFGAYVLDTREHTLCRAGVHVSLTPRAFDTLCLLVSHRGQLVTKEQLIHEVWRDASVEDNNLTQQVSALRRIFEVTGDVRIETVPKRGYRLVSDPAPPPAAEPALAASPPAPRTGLTRLRYVTAVAVLTGLGAAAMAASWPWRRQQPDSLSIKISRLTNLGAVSHASLSRDGRQLAYTLDDGTRESLWVKHLETGVTTRLVAPAVGTVRGVTAAPDGWVYYAWFQPDRSDVGIFRVSAAGGPVEPLPNLWDLPAFSPDGRRYACVTTTSSSIRESKLLVHDVGSGEKRSVALRYPPAAFLQTKPAWSPDGERLAVWTMTSQSPEVRQLVVITVGTGSERLVASERLHTVDGVAWRPDGASLIVAARERASSPLRLWEVMVDTGVRRAITEEIGDYRLAGLTGDGRRLAAVRVEVARSVWVASLADPSRARQVSAESGELAGLESLAWLGDGRLLYTSAESGNADIWLLDPNTQQRRQLTTHPGDDFNPAGLGGGETIAFASDRSGAGGIWVMSSAGESSARQITHGSDSRPALSPDGRWVVFQRGIVRSEPVALWRVPVAGGPASRITDGTTIRPAVSPDSQQVAHYWLTPTRWALAVIPITGGLPIQVLPLSSTHSGRAVRWSPDGRALAYVDGAGGTANIWLQPLDGGPPRRLTSFSSGRIETFDWSSDGANFAWISRHEVSDAVVLELSPSEGVGGRGAPK